VLASALFIEKLSKRTEGLALYLDLHAHAQKNGCFVFGNNVPILSEQMRNVGFSKLLALYVH